jgi:hypothetical protein
MPKTRTPAAILFLNATEGLMLVGPSFFVAGVCDPGHRPRHRGHDVGRAKLLCSRGLRPRASSSPPRARCWSGQGLVSSPNNGFRPSVEAWFYREATNPTPWSV